MQEEPTSPKEDVDWLETHRSLVECFSRLARPDGSPAGWMPRLSPLPLVLDFPSFDKMLSIQEALYASMRCVLQLWWERDAQVCSVLDLPDKLERVLRSASPSGETACPFVTADIGCYRPDLLVDEDGIFRVCEINARFSLNGYFMSVFLAQAAQSGLFPDRLPPSAFFAENNAHVNSDCGSVVGIPSTLAFPQALRNRLFAGEDNISVVFVISDREPGHDLQWLSSLASGADERIRFEHVRSSSLSAHYRHCDANEETPMLALTANGERVQSCILELHQDELLSLDEEVLRALLALSLRGKCLNPLWTIALLHDKRLLSLLPHLPMHTHALQKLADEYRASQPVLRKHIVPTVVCDLQSLSCEQLTHISHAWNASLVAKPALLGKGEGIVLQGESSVESFFASLSRHRESLVNALSSFSRSGSLVLQPFVTQRRFDVYIEPHSITSGAVVSVEAIRRHWCSVGTLLCMDSRFFGPGVFRFSSSPLISLSSDGIAVAPVHRIASLSPSNIVRADHWDVEDCEIVRKMRRSLIRDGIALFLPTSTSLHRTRDDSLCLGEEGEREAQQRMNESLMRLLGEKWRALMRAPVCSSENKDNKNNGAPFSSFACATTSTDNVRSAESEVLWTISPQSSGLARSHKCGAFPTHTDASFESSPPRFIALAVHRDDRCGGGRSGFAPIAPAIARLTDEEYDALRSFKVQWTVPPEFRAPAQKTEQGEKERGEDPSLHVMLAPVLMSRWRARVRADIMSAKHLSPGERLRFQSAFDKLHSLLSTACERDAQCAMPVGAVLLLDNQRFVHSRSAIRDVSRSLSRIRFDLPLVPEMESLLDMDSERSCNNPSDSVKRLEDWPIMRKQDLLNAIHIDANDTADSFIGRGDVYWSPSGGSTSSSLSAEQCAIPSSNGENAAQRRLMGDQLRQFGALHAQSVVVNCLATGQLYRSMEIFHDWIVAARGTDLPLGATASEETILSTMHHFRANTVCCWPSKLLKIIDVARERNMLHVWKAVHTVIVGGEPLSRAAKRLLRSVCAPQCRIFGVFGSAETGIFAATLGVCPNSNDAEGDDEDVYVVVPDSVHVELLSPRHGDEQGSSGLLNAEHFVRDEEGTLVVTNLQRRGHSQRVVRFWMNDQAQWLSARDKQRLGIEMSLQAFRLLGRAPEAISFPMGPVFLRWTDVKEHVLRKFADWIAMCRSSSIVTSNGSHSDSQSLDDPMAMVAAQLWIEQSLAREGWDDLCLRVYLPIPAQGNNSFEGRENTSNGSEGDDDSLERDFEAVLLQATDSLSSLVSEVDNIQSVQVKIVASRRAFAVNKRSSKLMFFVDNRNREFENN